jgi:hypothetical protein
MSEKAKYVLKSLIFYPIAITLYAIPVLLSGAMILCVFMIFYNVWEIMVLLKEGP